eukprot:CAMPEP_0194507238 /NCGR_PEP_ID=MMETSP0253-20130528/36477_1 /TAXON_ID=2966 /ORGANISM="Noctiluca scintillans" /LENGTH=158 /DNA_ID=CAMNT_0039350101 /DNA_START=21 /DNA_END=497 /DNA_ORIENTATION=+
MALHQAAKNSDVNAINALLDDENVDIDALDENGLTALHHVAATGNAAIGAMLAECDADVNLADPQGNTPLHFAAKHNSRLVASMLLWGGADRDAKNATGNTALHECALSDSQDVAYLIMENGGEDTKDERNKDGFKPIEIAKANGKVKQYLETGEHVD